MLLSSPRDVRATSGMPRRRDAARVLGGTEAAALILQKNRQPSPGPGSTYVLHQGPWILHFRSTVPMWENRMHSRLATPRSTRPAAHGMANMPRAHEVSTAPV